MKPTVYTTLCVFEPASPYVAMVVLNLLSLRQAGCNAKCVVADYSPDESCSAKLEFASDLLGSSQYEGRFVDDFGPLKPIIYRVGSTPYQD